MAETVRDAMTSDPETIEPGTAVADAARIMKEADTGIVPMVEGDRLIGTLTDRDIVIGVVAEGRDPQAVKAGEVASRELVTVDPDQDLDKAMGMMAKHRVRRLPVVEEDGRLVGILSQADVAAEYDEAGTGQMVNEISQ